MKSLLLLLPLCSLPVVSALLPAQDEAAADRAKVERAVLDYVEALYEVKPELIARSVHPAVAKFGFARRSADEAYLGFAMSYDELFALAGEWNDDGDKAGPTSPKEVVVLDVLDQTAAAKLTAEWGVDYMHLAKYDGEWKILQVLWQTPPVE